MRLKSFHAQTMSEAMQMVRDTLGDEAVIVATREDRGGERRRAGVHVTAAIDPSNYSEPAFEIAGAARRDAAAPAQDWLQYDDEEEEFAIAEELTEVMLRHNVPEDVMDNVLSCATVIGVDNPYIALIAAVEHLFHFRPLPDRAHRKPIMMVGQPGAGKTVSVAKATANAVLNDLSVGVITTDTVRAGGVEQLQSFTKLLDVRLLKARDDKGLLQAINHLRDCDQIYIDTAGVNPFDRDDIRMLARLTSAEDMDCMMVLPAGIDVQESGEMARAFATLGVHTILPTRVDIARRLGGILAAAHQGSMSLSHASHTPNVANGLMSLTPRSLAKLLMPNAEKSGQRS